MNQRAARRLAAPAEQPAQDAGLAKLYDLAAFFKKPVAAEKPFALADRMSEYRQNQSVWEAMTAAQEIVAQDPALSGLKKPQQQLLIQQAMLDAANAERKRLGITPDMLKQQHQKLPVIPAYTRF